MSKRIQSMDFESQNRVSDPVRTGIVCLEASKGLLENAITRLGLSARAYDRILKVSRTLADMEVKPTIEPQHVSEAIQYRTLDRNFWA